MQKRNKLNNYNKDNNHKLKTLQVTIISVQTKLYSFKFDCRIVSLTAAKTNLIFSVSRMEKTQIIRILY